MADRSRKYKLLLHLSNDEKYILEEKWKASGLPSRSAFIRNLIIHGFVYDIDYSALTEYSKQLNKIGVNINQIVRRIMKTGNAYSDDIAEIKKLMEDVWHTHESMLSRQPLTRR